MESVVVELKNCYGIRALSHRFDASQDATFLIYAPNGVMKSCFARVFDDVSRGQSPRDAVFRDRVTSHSIVDEAGSGIPADRILVVKPFDQHYSSEKTATLMLREDLRRQYESLVEAIQSKAQDVSAALAGSAGVRRIAVDELLGLYPQVEDDFFACLDLLHSDVVNLQDPGLAHIQFGEVFNDKVRDFLSKASTRQLLGEYVERYEELLRASTYFRRGVFNHTNATSVHKALTDNGFFAAKHSVSLADRDDRKTEIATPEALQLAIETEKQQILSDPELAKRFDTMDKAISRNAELRRFRDYLQEFPDLIPRLLDLAALKKDLWLSYAFTCAPALREYSTTYRSAKERIGQLVKAAREQETEWRRIVDIFHSRFSVPFTLKVANQDDVILKLEAPTLVFQYHDRSDEREIGSNELHSVLSTGELRALYLLNVIFEIEARMREEHRTVLILDDVADSFDYKNKYAIVEYLKDMQDSHVFIMLVLTHNFDFFRTVQSRLGIGRARNCLMATKTGDGIVLVQAENLDPFRNWKKNLHQNRRMLLATIPMARNLVEYTRGSEHSDYIFLTSLLHMKPGTKNVTMGQLAAVVNGIMGTCATGGHELVVDAIYEEAASCTACEHSVHLENKVVLSVAIRLLAEELMMSAIADPSVTNNIKKHQTRVLYDAYCSACGNGPLKSTLQRVLLMTPDTIHLNSFMYEPILDMSDDSLRALYDDLRALPTGSPA